MHLRKPQGMILLVDASGPPRLIAVSTGKPMIECLRASLVSHTPGRTIIVTRILLRPFLPIGFDMT
jgi:hypothetical protein